MTQTESPILNVHSDCIGTYRHVINLVLSSVYFLWLPVRLLVPIIMQLTSIWQPHIRKIIFYCLLITSPMLFSSFVILAIVYSHLVTPSCPSQELCSAPNLVNSTSSSFYYVDFPAARLAFISSWSATISFALVGFMMVFASYADAYALLRASEKDNQEELPSPHEMSIMLRVLNAEMMVLWDLTISKLSDVFWKREKDMHAANKTSPILRKSVIILLGGVFAR